MRKVLLAVATASLLTVMTVPAQAGIGGKTKPPVEQSCGWWDQFVAAFTLD